ncbi:MAG: carboxypeptidase regulatory-like domain-containing protein [Clostridia bacterium]|nr:carboxypeptidase regulatory-like domain-containing protein [Clostridia bacterium]
MKKTIAGALALLFCLLGCCGLCEETRKGDYIYVPQVTPAPNAGMTTLRVEGTVLAGDGTQQRVENLAGALFGVYVFSGEGELTPWADPLYPFEPMRLKTGDGPLSFTLPSGIDFYLRQEAAPEGFVYDGETLVPVTSGEMVIRNLAEGELRLVAQDTQGKPLGGVGFAVLEDGERVASLVTDETGSVTMKVKREMRLELAEETLPDGLLPALYALQGDESLPAAGFAAEVRPAERLTVEWIHPSQGTVQLNMSAASVGPDGEKVLRPLQGVTMKIGDTGETLTTDETGSASLSVMEGTYLVTFGYSGTENVLLPLEQGQMIVDGGALTLIELEAQEQEGRVAVQLNRQDVEGSFSLKRAGTGESYGPYAFDTDGRAVSDAVIPGRYEVQMDLPEGALLQGFTAEGTEPGDIPEADVAAGTLTQAEAQVSVLSAGRYRLTARRISESGDYTEEAIGESIEVALLDENGNVLQTLRTADGQLELRTLDGTYALRMEADWAAELGLLDTSEAFAHTEEGGSITFKCDTGRLILQSKDAQGAALPGAVYSVTDGSGAVSTLECDESGTAVTGPLQPGQIRIDTVSAPEGCAPGGAWTAELEAGAAAAMELVHARLGRETILARLQSLDGTGSTVLTPLAGALIRIVQSIGGMEGETVALLTADEDGSVSVSLPEGEYIAYLQETGTETLEGTALTFTAVNDQESTDLLTAPDLLGGIRVTYGDGTLTDAQTAQARFCLYAAGAEEEIGLYGNGNVFTAFGLPAGDYILKQTQAPEGKAPARDRNVRLEGGTVTEIGVPLDEYARLSVSKVGLTFNASLQTFVVPLEGEYAVYTMRDGSLMPYPSEAEQMKVWANVSGEEGKPAEILLPADAEGTTYFLKETGKASGFVLDGEAHEIVLHAGETARPQFPVASDRGFMTVDARDERTGEHLSGGAYALLDENGDTVLTFSLDENEYRTETALPVGRYTLRQTEAPEGYALAEEAEKTLELHAYLSGRDEENRITVGCRRLPEAGDGSGKDAELWMAQEQGLSLIGVEYAAGADVKLERPQVILETQAEGRTDIDSLTLSGAADAEGNAYRARVEYALRNGGWQPSRAKETGLLDAPTTISFAEVEGNISALRITYLDGITGRETANEGFVPGEAVLCVRAEGDEPAEVRVNASFAGTYCYKTRWAGETLNLSLGGEKSESFLLDGSGSFGTESGGKDGAVSGFAFLDTDGDGLLGAAETGRCAGLSVSLLDEAGNTVDTVRTATDGRYAFAGIPSGTYSLRFEAGGVMVFSGNRLYSEHAASRVTEARRGTTDAFTVDGDHTDHYLLAGCLYASGVSGRIESEEADGTTDGMGGVSVELMHLGHSEEEPILVSTDDTGVFSFTGLVPGDYELQIKVPDGYLALGSGAGLRQTMTLEQGESGVADFVALVRQAAVSGTVWLDEPANGLPGVTVTLLHPDGGSVTPVETTTTGADGRYAFGALYPYAYSIQAELPDQYGFAPYGEHSGVFGAAGHTGSTQTFELKPGENREGLDIGATVPASLTVRVFRDAQADGLMQPNEKGLDGVSIVLIRREEGTDGEKIALLTDEEGKAQFSGLTPGSFALSYEMPGQWRPYGARASGGGRYPESILPTSAARTGRSAEFTLTSGEQRELYIAAAMTGTVSGFVFEDANADARRADGESAMPGIPVQLLDQTGETVAETVTAEDGSYTFEGLSAGRYRVRFKAPEEYGFVATQRSLVANGAQGTTDPVSETRAFTLSQGTTAAEVNAAIVRLAAVEGNLWEDLDADGLPEAEERKLSGVEIELLDGNGRTAVQTASTDAQGHFRFERLMPGNYRLRISLLDGHVFLTGEGSRAEIRETRMGSGVTDAFTVQAGETLDGFDYAMLIQGSVSGHVWNDENYNGLAEKEESGLRNLTLTLLDEEDKPLASVKTGRDGSFAFERLMPGSYKLRISLEEGYVFTCGGADSAAQRSDETEQTIALSPLAMGEAREGILIGALKPGELTGRVWYDANDDGRRQSAEAAMKEIPVTLKVLSGTDSGREIETATGEDGSYRFEGVMPGEAELRFTLPEGYAFAHSLTGRSRVSILPETDAAEASTGAIAVAAGGQLTDLDAGVVGVGTVSGQIWDDRDYDGRNGADEAGVSGITVALTSPDGGKVLRTVQTGPDGTYEIGFVRTGEYRVQITLPADRMFTRGGNSFAETDDSVQQTAPFALSMGEGRADVDAGVILPAELGGALLENGKEGAGAAGVSVTLYEGGTLLRTVQTGEDGSFALKRLRPGSYRLRVILPEDLLFSEDAWLLPADPNDREGETPAVELKTGDSLGMRPVPVVRAASVTGKAWSDLDADGRMTAGEPALPMVRVTLTDEWGSEIAAAVTGEDGLYTFGRLRAGEYALRFQLPEGHLFADYTGDAQGSSVKPTEGTEAQTGAFALTAGQAAAGMNVGAILPGEIGDTVWFDVNGNGLQDYREQTVPDIRLILTKRTEDGSEETLETVSDQYGYYHFRNLRPGDYILQLTPQEKYSPTLRFAGGLNEIDSDIDPDTGTSGSLHLNSGERLLNVDVGLVNR